MAIGTRGISGGPSLGSGGTAGTATGFVPSPPPGSPGGGTPGTGGAPAMGPFLLYSADSDLPDAVVLNPWPVASTAPSTNYTGWIDSSTTPPTPRYWNGSAWTAWPVAAVRWGQSLVGAVNGSNVDFTLPATPVYGFAVYADGVRCVAVSTLTAGGQYTYNSATAAIVFYEAPRKWAVADIQ